MPRDRHMLQNGSDRTLVMVIRIEYLCSYRCHVIKKAGFRTQPHTDGQKVDAMTDQTMVTGNSLTR